MKLSSVEHYTRSSSLVAYQKFVFCVKEDSFFIAKLVKHKSH
jgi:hypothetical protein